MSSKSLNKVTLIGNVTRDPELRYTPQGNAVSTFGLATNRSWKTEGGEIREEAEFHRLVAWNKLAELCSQLCTKGRKIYVEGRLQTRTFTGSDNAQHTITEIVIDDMILLDSKFAQGGGTGYQPGQPAVSPPAGGQPAAEPVVAAPAAVIQTQYSGDKKPKTKKAKEEKVEKEKLAEEAKPEEAETKPAEEAKEDVNIDDIPF